MSRPDILSFHILELCDAVGHDVRPETFADDALKRIADQIDAEASACQGEGDRWHELYSIAQRARFAALVARRLRGEDLRKESDDVESEVVR